MFEEEDGYAVVGSPRGEQHIPLFKCRFHHKSGKSLCGTKEKLKLSHYPKWDGTRRLALVVLAYITNPAALIGRKRKVVGKFGSVATTK